MVEEAILVLRVMSLRYLVLIQRFLRFAEETVAIAEISAHIGIIASEGDRLLVVLDCVRPILPVIVPVRGRDVAGPTSSRDGRTSGMDVFLGRLTVGTMPQVSV